MSWALSIKIAKDNGIEREDENILKRLMYRVHAEKGVGLDAMVLRQK